MTTAITQIKAIGVHKIEGGKLKAYVDICIDDAYIVKGFKVFEGKDGLFVGMPSVKGKNGEKYFETVSCTNQDTKDDLSNTVLAAYKNH